MLHTRRLGGNCMKIKMLFCIFVILTGSALFLFARPGMGSSDASGEASKAAINAVMADQTAAWNRGDVVEFMKGYWNSPGVSFAGSSGLMRGYQTVLDHYKKSYPDQKTMGHLDFSDLEIRMLGNNAALVIGRWHLKRESDEVGGIFSLTFEKFPEGWKIIHDHTSADAKK
jgi:ketosteroid isomerase-like protein